jgi:zona occludens toxin
MITLITGVPGAGKTLNTLQDVESERGDREVFYRQIDGLTLDWNLLTDEECHNWNNYPDGSIFVFDEAHQVWPNIPSNRESPASVMLLDQHRHKGYDFYVITQKGTKVDFRVRDLVGRHYHYERGFNANGTRRLEWQKAVSNCDDYHNREEAEIKRIPFNKDFYNVYKSAEVHTHKRRIPKAVYYFAAAILATGTLSAFAYTSIMERSSSKDEITVSGSSYPKTDRVFNDNFSPRSTKNDRSDYAHLFTPRIADIPFSAPAYDDVTEVKTYPRPQCIYHIKNDSCNCFTQQATPLNISYSQCINNVENGWFNPFRDEEREGESEKAARFASPSSDGYKTEPVVTPSHRVIYLNSGSSSTASSSYAVRRSTRLGDDSASSNSGAAVRPSFSSGVR